MGAAMAAMGAKVAEARAAAAAALAERAGAKVGVAWVAVLLAVVGWASQAGRLVAAMPEVAPAAVAGAAMATVAGPQVAVVV